LLGKRLDLFRKLRKDEAAFREVLYFTYAKVERALGKLARTEGWISAAECTVLFGESHHFRTIFNKVFFYFFSSLRVFA
jgi:hypothetical protein